MNEFGPGSFYHSPSRRPYMLTPPFSFSYLYFTFSHTHTHTHTHTYDQLNKPGFANVIAGLALLGDVLFKTSRVVVPVLNRRYFSRAGRRVVQGGAVIGGGVVAAAAEDGAVAEEKAGDGGGRTVEVPAEVPVEVEVGIRDTGDEKTPDTST